MVDLSIIMINHNTKWLTEQAVSSIVNGNVKYSYEIIVVDNSDREEEFFTSKDEHVKVLERVENKGFAHGCNTGVKNSTGRFLLFLNSDTIMRDDTLNTSIEEMNADGTIGGLGVKLVKEDGTLDHACKRGFPTPWNSLCYFAKIDRFFPKVKLFNGYCLRYLSDDEISDVDAVNGAYLLMPRQVYDLIGGWDESFFMYGEDLDLCYKIHEAGYRIVYNPTVECVHLKGKSGRASENPFVQYHFYNAMLIFYDRYYSKKYSGILTWGIKTLLKRKVSHYKQILVREGKIC